jgi:hypothetical protein
MQIIHLFNEWYDVVNYGDCGECRVIGDVACSRDWVCRNVLEIC